MFKALFFSLSIALLGGIADRALALGALGKTQASYTVKIAGIPAGLLGIAANTSNRQYAVAGDIRSTGIVAAFAKVHFKATSRGWFRGAYGFKPRDYRAESLSKAACRCDIALDSPSRKKYRQNRHCQAESK